MNKFFIWKRCVATLSLMVGLVATQTVAANDAPADPIRIAVQDRVPLALLSWAESRGDFAKESLQPQLLPTSAASVDAIADGEIDLIAGGAHTLLQAASFSIALRGVLVLGYSTTSDAVLGRVGLTDIAQLRGATVAIVDDNSRGASEILLADALQRRGLSASRTTIIYLPEAEALASISTGEIDAVVSGEPALGRIERKAAETSGTLPRLADSSRQPGIVADLLMGEELWLRSNKEIVKRVIRVWNRVTRAAARDPAAAATAVATILEIDKAAAATALAGSRLFDTSGNVEILRGDYQKAFATMSLILAKRDNRPSQGVVSANRLLDLAPLRQVARDR